jgi:RNA polymerase sigma-70 factor (ECF subfamily)
VKYDDPFRSELVSAAATHAPRLAAAAAGDDAALSQLVQLYHQRVYRYGVRVCRDGFDADDAVQEAFLKLARRPDVVASPSTFGWLLRVVRNACLRLLRPLSRRRLVLGEAASLDDVVAEDPSPEAALERWELVHAVHAAIASLAPPYRAVLVLRDLEGLSGEEASAALGLDLATLKTRLHRARAQLRQQVARARAEVR